MPAVIFFVANAPYPPLADKLTSKCSLVNRGGFLASCSDGDEEDDGFGNLEVDDEDSVRVGMLVLSCWCLFRGAMVDFELIAAFGRLFWGVRGQRLARASTI